MAERNMSSKTVAIAVLAVVVMAALVALAVSRQSDEASTSKAVPTTAPKTPSGTDGKGDGEGSSTKDAPTAADPCGRSAEPVKRYEHVVVMLEENRTWTGGRTSEVGMGFGGGEMPYLASLASKCSYFEDWEETDGTQNSLNQYVGLTSGIRNDSTINDCEPSDTCKSLDDNIFRQVRESGGTARSFVDGATEPCSAGTNKAKHIPAVYFQGGEDASHCKTEVLPFSELDPDHLPTFAFVTPDMCNDGHDCGNDVVDAWAKKTLTAVLDGKSYGEGKTLVVVVYDEDQPVPNLLVAPTADKPGISSMVGSHASLLKTIEQLLGLPVLDQGQLPEAKSLRSAAHI